MEDLTVLVLIENAVAGKILAVLRVKFTKIVNSAMVRALLRPVGDVEVVIEIGVKRRHPFEFPTHFAPYRFDLINRRMAYGHIAHIVAFKVIEKAIDV